MKRDFHPDCICSMKDMQPGHLFVHSILLVLILSDICRFIFALFDAARYVPTGLGCVRHLHPLFLLSVGPHMEMCF